MYNKISYPIIFLPIAKNYIANIFSHNLTKCCVRGIKLGHPNPMGDTERENKKYTIKYILSHNNYKP
jgi:hypothetical protein